MTLIVAVYVPTGIALSGDSRTTATLTGVVSSSAKPGAPTAVQTPIIVSDATQKIFLVHGRFGVATTGEALVNNMPIAHYVQDFEANHKPSAPHTTLSFAKDLLAYFSALSPPPKSGFFVVGYDGTDPWVVVVDVQAKATNRVNLQSGTSLVDYGIVRGGDTAVANRLLSQAQFNPPFNAMNLQDAVDFSRHLIRTSIDQMRFEPRFATVGGPIDTLVVTPSIAQYLAHKELRCT